MLTANERLKATERATAIGLLSAGVSLLGTVLTLEGIELVRYLALGGGAIIVVAAGLHRRMLAFLNRVSGPGFIGFLSIFIPVAGLA